MWAPSRAAAATVDVRLEATGRWRSRGLHRAAAAAEAAPARFPGAARVVRVLRRTVALQWAPGVHDGVTHREPSLRFSRVRVSAIAHRKLADGRSRTATPRSFAKASTNQRTDGLPIGGHSRTMASSGLHTRLTSWSQRGIASSARVPHGALATQVLPSRSHLALHTRVPACIQCRAMPT